MLFKEIIGHKEIKNRLIKSVNENRISHAQLFLGSEGAGSLQLAIAYSQYICCSNKVDNDSCGKCSSCIKYNKLAHPDLHIIIPSNKIYHVMPNGEKRELKLSAELMFLWRDEFLENNHLNYNQWMKSIDTENKAGIISADESNELVRIMNLKTYESKYKIAIIWLPEKLNLTAANKLLKLIEEPPDNSLILLIAENSDQIINTILSRTQLIKINKPTDEELIKAVMVKYNYTKEQAEYIVHLADGNQNEIQ